MKKYIVLILLGVCFFLSAQPIRRLNDPSIVAQHKRMVFERWGDWRPYPKYTLFHIQTNLNYATVWGMWAPSRNRKYKNGKDIRPLKVDGAETQRLLKAEAMKKEAEKIKVSVDSIHLRTRADFAHITHMTVGADPLWLLYYKRMLKPLKEFPENPQSNTDWGITNINRFELMKGNGELDKLQKSLDLLKDKYEKSRKLDMPRGKRFLMYHETLIGWRAFKRKLKEYDERNKLYIEYENAGKLIKEVKSTFTTHRSDKEIVESIMQKYKHQF
ncbi:hypothetical protein [Ornithobacterium rhinotracheale]|uniref:hypothetical protein n=1 Tax=Ornithobacterium rhinotracheale TaxID=28251 RepID=UPI0040363726